ncbi:putative TetR family transcriptional regulator [Nocardia asteroides NBRC 15531]|uniref:TetR family transcriptional regulator n=1 Tax=Nocardia asteroides NBRC 15531 TaxID=1110697 RepID=U5ELW4_NOCAS|nr:putative TetR family transcriptional regulator [Nocardia asteroides NBRC 15531]SFM28718.1 transcriptional regulator, TetR family [Nocardia asteroides]VEG35758.1 DNA-binding transcriptional regulator EnvR [Nocardia asteroides]
MVIGDRSACYRRVVLSTAATSGDSPTDSVEERILDAALIQFQQVGVRKTTIEDIARAADVDRATVYRRIGSRDDVVRAAFEREVRRLLEDLREIPARHDRFDDIVVEVFSTVITRWRAHPLVERLLTLEADRLLPQLTVDGASFFLLSVAASTEIVAKVLEDNRFPEIPDLTARVEVVCRVVHSLILQPVGTVDTGSPDALAAYARAYIVPILTR